MTINTDIFMHFIVVFWNEIWRRILLQLPKALVLVSNIRLDDGKTTYTDNQEREMLPRSGIPLRVVRTAPYAL